MRESGYDAEKLQLCLDAAIAEAASPDPISKPAAGGQDGKTASPADSTLTGGQSCGRFGGRDWRSGCGMSMTSC